MHNTYFQTTFTVYMLKNEPAASTFIPDACQNGPKDQSVIFDVRSESLRYGFIAMKYSVDSIVRLSMVPNPHMGQVIFLPAHLPRVFFRYLLCLFFPNIWVRYLLKFYRSNSCWSTCGGKNHFCLAHKWRSSPFLLGSNCCLFCLKIWIKLIVLLTTSLFYF